MFWTRCVRAVADNTDVPLTLEVSLDPDFVTVAAEVALTAAPTFDFTVRAKVTGLPAATLLYYRFVASSDVSAMGTAKTAPAPNVTPAQRKFAWFACQNWSFNHWGAMSLLV